MQQRQSFFIRLALGIAAWAQALARPFAAALARPSGARVPPRTMDDWVHDISDDEFGVDFGGAGQAAPAADSAAIDASARDAEASASALKDPPVAAEAAAEASAGIPKSGAPAAPGRARKSASARVPPRLRAPGRALKRKPSLGAPAAVQCAPRLCVWGGSVKQPAVVQPTVQRGALTFFPIHERLFWLRRACGDRGTTHWTSRFQHAVSALRRVLKDGVSAHAATTASARKHVAWQDAKDALGLRADEAGGQGAAPPKRPRPAARLPPETEAVRVLVGEVSLQVRAHERPWEVEATAEAVMAVVDFCRARVEDVPIVLRRDAKHGEEGEGAGSSASASAAPAVASAQASPRGYALEAASCPAVLGKITWHPSVKAWAAHYKDKAGAYKQKRFGVRMPRASLGSGAATEGDADKWAQARRQAYDEAIRFWNEQDSSKRDRIEQERC